MSMKNPKKYNEVLDANYIIRMMEDVFGHRITSWSPKDTLRLKNKLEQPISDDEKEVYVSIVEPLMNKKSYIPKKKDAFLDSFVDLTTRVNPEDFEHSDEDELKRVEKNLGVDLT
jgi:DNA polymerase II large subunit